MRKRHIFLRSVLSLLAILLLLPLVLTLVYSFCSPAEIKEFMGTRNQYGKQLMEIKLSPEMFSLDQYWRVLIQDTSILRYYFNSIMYTVAILLGQAVVIPMLAYALSRFSFRGRDVIAFAVIVLLLLPFQVTMVPTVLTLRSIGLMDTMWAIILPSLASPFYVFLLRQSMVGIPGELFEAAQIDGAGPIRCYFHIALPVSKAIIGAAVALSFADCWNMVEQPLVFLPMREDLHPLSVAFNQLSQESTGIEFAGATLYILPALIVEVSIAHEQGVSHDRTPFHQCTMYEYTIDWSSGQANSMLRNDKRNRQAVRMNSHSANACWWQRPQSPLKQMNLRLYLR